MLSPVRLSVCLSVCLSSVTLVRPTQVVEIFGNISTALAILDIQGKFYGDRPRGTPPSGELNTTGVAEYSNFGPIEGYISEMVQDIGGKVLLSTNRNPYGLSIGTTIGDLE